MPRASYTLNLIDAGRPGEPPVEIRLRQMLKVALRAFSLRCDGIERRLVTKKAPTADGGQASDAGGRQ